MNQSELLREVCVEINNLLWVFMFEYVQVIVFYIFIGISFY